MVRFLHTSDWQIGMRGGGLGAAAPEVRRRRLVAVERLLEVAAAHGCAFVVAAGDLFEHHGVDHAQVEEVARRLGAFPALDVHAIPGNHDLAGPGSVWNRAALRNVANLHVHVEPGPVPLSEHGVTLWPFPVKSKHARHDPLSDAEVVRDLPGVHVAIAHGHLTTVTFGGHEVDVKLPIDPAHVERCGFDYLALGHWHGARIVRTADGAPRIAYSGTPERTSYEEIDAGTAFLVEIESPGAPPVLTPIPIGAVRWADVSFRFAGDDGADRLARELELVEADLLRLTLAGEAPVGVYAEVRELLAAKASTLQDLRVRDAELIWRPDESEASLAPLADASLAEVRRRLEQVLHEAGDGPDVAVAREAARLFAQTVREAGLCD